jgi:hypothetical protein
VQVARAHADERIQGRRPGLVDLERAVGAAPRAPDRQLRREEEALERVVADGVGEERLVVTALQAERSALLDVDPADGQVVGAGQLVVDQRLRAHGRPDDGVAAIAQRADERVELGPVDDGVLDDHRYGTKASTRRAERRHPVPDARSTWRAQHQHRRAATRRGSTDAGGAAGYFRGRRAIRGPHGRRPARR